MTTSRQPEPGAPATSVWPLVCSVCGEGLSRRGSSLFCPRGHSFDVARDGYVNLLGGGKRPAGLGDSAEMLRARRAFLDGGHYAPLAAAIAEQVQAGITAVEGTRAAVVCDVGCGEGYYLAAVKESFASSRAPGEAAFVGIDVAKEAARMAARRYPGITFVVADAWRRLPLADSSVVALLNVFAPRNPTEFARVLAPGGVVIVAIPAPEHLAEPRERWGLLAVEADKAAHLQAQMSPALILVGERHLRYSLDLDGPEMRALVAMGPSARHLSADTLAAIAAGPRARVSVAFDVLVFGQNAD